MRVNRFKPLFVMSMILLACSIGYSTIPLVLADEGDGDSDPGATCGCCGGIIAMILAPIIGSLAIFIIFIVFVLCVTAGIVYVIVRVVKYAWFKDEKKKGKKKEEKWD